MSLIPAIVLACHLCGAVPSELPVYSVQTRTGTLQGRLAGFDEDGTLRLADPERVVAPEAWFEVQAKAASRPPLPQREVLRLSHGDWLPLEPGTTPRLQQGRLLVQPSRTLGDGPPWSLFLPYVSSWVAVAPAADGSRGSLPGRDILLLRNGDRVEGSLVKLQPKEPCEMQANQRTLAFPIEQVSTVLWNSESQARPKWRKPAYHVILASGARLHCKQLRFLPDTQRWQGKTWFASEVEFDAAQLVALERWFGDDVFLSDLEPQREIHTPYLDVAHPWERLPACVLAGSVYEKAIRQTPRSELTYRLDGGYRWFDAQVGLEETATSKSRIRIAVKLDGKVHGVGEDRSLADGPAHLRINVRDVRELTLSVDFGSFGPVRARALWANPRLIK